MDTNDLIRLAVDLWPRWTVTESIADLMVRQFEDLDPDCVERAIRDHRLTRSTVPDIGAIVSAAKSRHDAKRAWEAHQFEMRALKPKSHDLATARKRLADMDEDRRLWLWRYCREMARLGKSHERLCQWPKHWVKVTPPVVEWPDEVVEAYHTVHARLGV